MWHDGQLAAYEAILRFLGSAKQPVALEAGEETMALTADSYEVRMDGSRLLFHVWSEKRNLVRRVTAVEGETPGRLDLAVERFGRKPGTLQLLDNSRSAGEARTRRSGRLAYREQFRRSLLRQFTGWQVADLSCEADLEHSLSPSYPRAFLRKGASGWAAIGAATAVDAPSILTFGLIWLQYLRRREDRIAIEGLSVFLPRGSEASTCHRIRYLDPFRARYSVYVHADGWEQAVDVEDAGNIQTELQDRVGGGAIPEWVAELGDLPCAEAVECGEAVSYRIRGLEFANWSGRELRFGIDTLRRVTADRVGEVRNLAGAIAGSRDPVAADSRSRLYSIAPERWLESEIRRNLHQLDPSLRRTPVYGQALSLTGGERGIIDLLAIDNLGRLAILEVKASEDIHLPLQALDYWARVRWHLERDDFERKHYFPGLSVSRRSPRLLLVAPALHFHPSTETILRFFSSEVDVERIGVSADWRSSLKSVFRGFGSEAVGSAQSGVRDKTHESSSGVGAGSGSTGASEPF